jgi:hypothetical protein
MFIKFGLRIAGLAYRIDGHFFSSFRMAQKVCRLDSADAEHGKRQKEQGNSARMITLSPAASGGESDGAMAEKDSQN